MATTPASTPAPTTDGAVQGVADSRFDALREAFAAQLASGEELGGSIAVTVHGEPVVELWGGWADPERTTPWRRDTLVNVWSCTKTVTSLAALLLIDRGTLDPDAPVARYWPEFAAAGKEGVLVRNVLGHTSGVSGWALPITVEGMLDVPGATAALAAQAPFWEPGTASGYHLLDYGHLVGELIRRVDGRDLGTFVREELAQPLGADFAIGLDPDEFGRVSDVVPPPPSQLDFSALPAGHPALFTYGNPIVGAENAWAAEWRTSQLGAANGHGTAAGLARIQSILTNGGEVDGRRYLSPATIERVFEVQADGVDLVLFQPIRFGMGYALASPANPLLSEGRVAYWGGWGGSLVVDDVDRGVTFVYVMNRMSDGIIGSPRSAAYLAALQASLD